MDLVARVGGEEFAIILPSCGTAFGETVAERVRRCVETVPVALQGIRAPLRVTVSVGGAFAPQWVRSTPALWLERADQQLYRCKAQGRNRVCLEPVAQLVVSSEEKQLLFDSTLFQDLDRRSIRLASDFLSAANDSAVVARSRRSGRRHQRKGGVGRLRIGQQAAALPRRGRRGWCSTPTWGWHLK